MVTSGTDGLPETGQKTERRGTGKANTERTENPALSKGQTIPSSKGDFRLTMFMKDVNSDTYLFS